MNEKVDFKKTLDCYVAKRDQFRVIQVPPMRYLMVDGHGDPNTSPSYTQALQALYPVAYKLKFASKRRHGRDYVVPPLEGLWWAEDMNAFTSARDKSQWEWTLMLMVPEWIDDTSFHDAVDAVRAKGTVDRLDDVRIEAFSEGLCVQTLHIGPFDDEAAVLEQMHEVFIPSQGLQLSGKHHEIYFSDFRKVTPDKLRTILRQPVAQASPNQRALPLDSACVSIVCICVDRNRSMIVDGSQRRSRFQALLRKAFAASVSRVVQR